MEIFLLKGQDPSDAATPVKTWIVVAKHPYYVVTSEDGSYELDGVPPGTYTLTAWHETLGTQTQSVTVETEGTAEVNLTFGG